MGRKSCLTDAQWLDVERRMIVDGESMSSIARDYGVHESSIRRKISPRKPEAAARQHAVRDLARQKADAEISVREVARKIAALPLPAQTAVHDMAAHLVAITQHLGAAASVSAASAHRLSILSNQQLDKVDEVDPRKSMRELETSALLQKMANQAAELPTNLLRANKEAIDDLNKKAANPGKARVSAPTYKVVTA